MMMFEGRGGEVGFPRFSGHPFTCDDGTGVSHEKSQEVLEEESGRIGIG